MMAMKKMDFLRTLCALPGWQTLIDKLEECQVSLSISSFCVKTEQNCCIKPDEIPTEVSAPMVGQPKWLSWEYNGVSVPNAFAGIISPFRNILDWVVSASHVLENGDRLLSYDAAVTWTLAAGLIYRDLAELNTLKGEYAEAASRVRLWAGARANAFQDGIEKTWELLDREHPDAQRKIEKGRTTSATDRDGADEAGPSHVPMSTPTGKPMPPQATTPKHLTSHSINLSNDKSALLMTELDFAEGIITPPLCKTAPSDAKSRTSHLNSLSLVPALKELRGALALYSVCLSGCPFLNIITQTVVISHQKHRHRSRCRST
jgi:hypothetical protein